MSRESDNRTPFIIGGMMRSATRFTANLLYQHPNIIVTGQCPEPLVRDFIRYSHRLEAAMRRQKHEAPWERKGPSILRQQLVQLWILSSPGKSFDRYLPTEYLKSRYRIGHKTPWCEKFYDFYAEIFSDTGLRLIYCVRNPYDTLRSSLNHPDVTPYVNALTRSSVFSVLFYRYKRSIETALRIEKEHPSQIIYSQADKTGPSLRERLVFAEKLLDFIGEEMCPTIEETCKEWRITNSTRQVWEKRDSTRTKTYELTARENARIARDPLFTAYQKRFGYR